MSQEKVCGWCHASKDGDYTIAMFQSPNAPEASAAIGVYGGKLVVELTLPGETAQRLSCKINHCPFCGRAYGEEETCER